MRCVASTMQTNAGAKEATKFQGDGLCRRPMMYLWDRHAETGWCFWQGTEDSPASEIQGTRGASLIMSGATKARYFQYRYVR